MSLLSHAEKELRLAGLFDKDSDYNGMVGKAVLELIKTFSKQGHSGFSAGWCLDLFNKLAQHQPLTPISADPSEWTDVSAMSGYPMWQNNRRYSSFSNDGGKTWYDLDDPEETKRGGGKPPSTEKVST